MASGPPGGPLTQGRGLAAPAALGYLHRMDITRGEFLRRLVGGAAVVGLAPLVACGSDDPPVDAAAVDAPGVDTPPDGPGVCLDHGTGAAIAANHGHSIEVAVADIAAGTARVYDITGEATHSHTVALTAADFAMLAANQPVTVTSSASGHTHQVTIYCV